jgi:hypothetical protein
MGNLDDAVRQLGHRHIETTGVAATWVDQVPRKAPVHRHKIAALPGIGEHVKGVSRT